MTNKEMRIVSVTEAHVRYRLEQMPADWWPEARLLLALLDDERAKVRELQRTIRETRDRLADLSAGLE